MTAPTRKAPQGAFVLAAWLALAPALTGCGRPADEPPQPAAEGDHALLDAAKAPLERAQEVEDISAGRKAQLDEEIDGAAR